MIRRALTKDVPAIAELYHRVWHETQAQFMPAKECTQRDLAFFANRMSALVTTTLVSQRDEEIVGFAAWRGDLLGQIFVAKSHRGSHVGARLLDAAENEMKREGTRQAELRCVVGNERARRFYERGGWTRAGEFSEPLADELGTKNVPFWLMTKAIGSK